MVDEKEIAVSAGVIALAAWAGWLDWRWRRIPNYLTIPALLVGFASNALAWGWPGAKASLEGAGLGLLVLLPGVLMRGLGAGDWKLMGALGAFLGPPRIVVVLLGTVAIAGLMAIVEMVRKRKVKETLSNLWVMIVAYSTFHVSAAREITLDNPSLMKLPFGVAAAAAAVLFSVFWTFRIFETGMKP